MQAGKKYLASDGYEYFMCPMTEFKVTQGEDTGTHKGTRAVDFASGTAGYRAPYYAPATVKCIAAYPSSGQGIWQTVNKVHCPNGYFGFVTFCTVHDDSFNAYVGMTIPQGSQLGNMGTKGYATGVHVHMEFIQSSYPGWIQNGYGIWTFKGTESFVDDTFYVDDTNIIYGGAGNWRKVPTQSSGYDDSQLIAETGRATFRNNVRIAVRKNSPTGEIVAYKNNGDVQDYSWKWIGNGHRYIVWQEGSDKLFCAVSGTEERPAEGSDDQWATFTAIPDPEPTPEPEPTPTPEPEPEPTPEFPSSVKFKGIDLSEHNDMPDLTDVDFVILRANWWTTTDEKFEEFSNTLEEKGIPYGVYCYDYCGDEETALEQAEYTYNLIKDKKVDLGVWMDMEDADGWKNKNNYLTKEHCSMVCKVFCDFFKSKGYYTGVYSSTWWFDNLVDTDYPKWVANWGTNNGTCQGDFSDIGVMHQYTSVPLDKNVMYVDMDVMKSNPVQEPEEPDEDPVVPEEPDISQENQTLLNTLLKLLIDFFKRLFGMK